MKKIAVLFIFIFVAATISSCKSSKKGCGLTGNIDMPTPNPIEKVSIQENNIA